MSRLTPKVTKVGSTGKPEPVTREYPMRSIPSTRDGIIVDGVVTRLEGEPPIARGGNWWPPR